MRRRAPARYEANDNYEGSAGVDTRSVDVQLRAGETVRAVTIMDLSMMSAPTTSR
jgi:hypothetical protein